MGVFDFTAQAAHMSPEYLAFEFVILPPNLGKEEVGGENFAAMVDQQVKKFEFDGR